MIRLVNVCFLIILIGCDSKSEQMKYPDTKKDFIQESVFGKKIDDPYRWLEDFSSEEALEWVKKQNELTDSLIANNYQKKIKADLEDVWIMLISAYLLEEGIKHFII